MSCSLWFLAVLGFMHCWYDPVQRVLVQADDGVLLSIQFVTWGCGEQAACCVEPAQFSRTLTVQHCSSQFMRYSVVL